MDFFYNFRNITNLKLTFNEHNKNLDSVSFVSFFDNTPSLKGKISWQQETILSFLEEYENSPTIDFTTFNLRKMSEFAYIIYSILSKVPFGETITYSELASKAGNPKAARAVGGIMKSNDFPLFIPCHRVVGKNGIGGFSSGVELKRKLLYFENN